MNVSVGFPKCAENKRAAFLAGLLLFCLSSPYPVWSFVNNPYCNFFLGAILALLFFYNKTSFSIKKRWLFIALIALLVLYWQTSGQNIFLFILLSPVLVIPFSRDSFADKAYQYFFTIYAVVMAISIIEYVLAVPGIISPTFTIAPLNELKGDVYKVYFTMVTMEPRPVRFCGPYDEPGVVGTMSALILAKENFNFKDKRVIVTFLAGLITFSVFFYVAVFICWLIIFLRHKKLIASILWLSLIMSVAMLLVINIPILNEKIAERLTIDETTGTIAGDNRANYLLIGEYMDSMHGRSFWLGIEDKAAYSEKAKGSCSIFNEIIVHGWLFLICYSLFFILFYLSYKERRVPFVVFIFLFFATIYQRPFLFSYFNIFIFTCMARSLTLSPPKYRIR